jgi:hypothetical protein
MSEWLVNIYAGYHHASPTWRFTVSADSKAMAISIGMWMFEHSGEYIDEFGYVDADKI